MSRSLFAVALSTLALTLAACSTGDLVQKNRVIDNVDGYYDRNAGHFVATAPVQDCDQVTSKPHACGVRLKGYPQQGSDDIRYTLMVRFAGPGKWGIDTLELPDGQVLDPVSHVSDENVAVRKTPTSMEVAEFEVPQGMLERYRHGKDLSLRVRGDRGSAKVKLETGYVDGFVEAMTFDPA